ncbi:gamma-glutamylcyclotransferase [Novosphingobium beihaiensis]|uniref:glutathione-specific gamma-glutamylcyclotransferase n=1 Tax=Novosphingobium beihaiensis TaxID=2930389 RepID=A0ABT0BS56_9SPHN|nr:gamma-glutamylcyclotransferase [Novosphingobium beihaiensis]MCJ2187882.1 gamma-glutamylcyclotransferase [Novosphingobium beihaiensis]
MRISYFVNIDQIYYFPVCSRCLRDYTNDTEVEALFVSIIASHLLALMSAHVISWDQSEGIAMWIFGYGSLMGDEWEAAFRCIRREKACLLHHERAFTKASTVNWGTKLHPAPTLQVVPRDGGVCHGVAFEFDADSVDAVLAYLQEREGKGFERREVVLKLENGETVKGDCFFYAGANVLTDRNLDEIADLVLTASGKDGTGIEYVRAVKRELDTMEIRDKATEALLKVMQRKGGL